MQFKIIDLDIDELLASVADIGLHLDEEQRKHLARYCRDLIYSDPEHAAEKIIHAIEIISGKSLSKKEKEKLSSAEKKERWLLLKKENKLRKKLKKNLELDDEHPFSLEQSRQIISKAAERLRIALSNESLDAASEGYFYAIKNEDAPVDRANTALLGVLKVGIAGAISIVVVYTWGNLIGIPDLNPNHDLSALGSENRLKAEYKGDPLGIKFRHVMQILADSPLNPKLSDFLEKNPVKTTAPILDKTPTPEPSPSQAPILGFVPGMVDNEAKD